MPLHAFVRSLATLATVSLVLAACSGGSGRGMLPLPAVAFQERDVSVPADGSRTAKVAFTVKLRLSKTVKAKSIAMTFSPTARGTALTFAANTTTATNPSCKGSPVQCSLKIKLPAASYLANFTAFTGSLTGGKPSGKKLSDNPNVPVKITSRGSIQIAFGGTPTAVAFLPAAGTSLIVDSTGYALSKCFSSQSVSVFGIDERDDLILGPKPPKPSLSSDTASVAITGPTSAAPNTFTLTRASLPSANSIVHLTAKVLPENGSPASRIVSLDINADICGVVTIYTSGITGNPHGIAVGEDGNVWFTEWPGKIAKITTSGTVTEYSSGLTANSYPQEIAAGPDGNLWFAECGADKIGKITTAGGITEYQIPHSGTAPWGVTTGPDKNVWFTENDAFGGNRIGAVTTTGSFSEFSSGLSSGAQPFGIVSGSDSRLWFAESELSKIGAITTNGTITEYSSGIYGAPDAIVAGPDGNLWFTESSGQRVGKITTTGQVTEYTNGIDYGNPFGITVGPDKNLWYADLTGAIGRVTTAGAITRYTGVHNPFLIVTGPDGSLWFTEQNDIGRMR